MDRSLVLLRLNHFVLFRAIRFMHRLRVHSQALVIFMRLLLLGPQVEVIDYGSRRSGAHRYLCQVIDLFLCMGL